MEEGIQRKTNNLQILERSKMKFLDNLILDNIITDSKNKWNIFNDHFTSNTNEQNATLTSENEIGLLPKSVYFTHHRLNEISDIIRYLKNTKSYGHDEISNLILKIEQWNGLCIGWNNKLLTCIWWVPRWT